MKLIQKILLINVLITFSVNAQSTNNFIKKTILNKHIFSVGETVNITIRAINITMVQDTLILPNSCEVFPVINDMEYLATFHKGCFEVLVKRIVPANDSISWQFEWPDSSRPELVLKEGAYSIYGEFGNWNTNSDTISFIVKKGITSKESSELNIPTKFVLKQNYPNPFNPNTIIKYSLPQSSKVTLKIYNILGTEIATLVDRVLTSGNYEAEFNASNLSSGIYFYTIQAGSFRETKKMILIK